MPLETATYTSQLVASNPAHSDQLSQADAHMRLIKSTVQATFPNFTAAALNSTQAQIDGTVTTVGTTGVSVLADAGVNFKTNNTDGLRNPVAGTVGVSTGGVVNTTWTSGGVQTTTLAASVALTGPGSAPIGATLIWSSNTLPTGAGTWTWCNGAAISRTTYATLFGLLSTTWGAGDGSTTFNVPDFQDVVLVGRDTMGGAAGNSLLSSISAGVKQALNSLFGADTHVLTVSEMPSHNHAVTDPGHAHNYTSPTTSSTFSYSVAPGDVGTTTSTTASNVTGITIQNQGGGAAHTNLQPAKTVNYIIRIA